MAPDDLRRRGGFVPLARLKPPSGGPAALYARARLARLRDVLGPVVGSQLVEWIDEGERVVLVLAGRGWEAALADEREELGRAVGRGLGRRGLQVEVRSRPEAEPPLRPADGARVGFEEPPPDLPEGQELRRRLERLGARFAERRRSRSDET